jgi:hypothetical protein
VGRDLSGRSHGKKPTGLDDEIGQRRGHLGISTWWGDIPRCHGSAPIKRVVHGRPLQHQDVDESVTGSLEGGDGHRTRLGNGPGVTRVEGDIHAGADETDYVTKRELLEGAVVDEVMQRVQGGQERGVEGG